MSLKFASNSGFVCSPVSKCLTVLVGGFHVASHIPALHSFFRRIVTGPDKIDSLNNFLRYLGSKFLFLDTKSTVFCCIVIYLFRILERRYGSLKFATNIIISCFISMSLEMLLEQYFEVKSFGPLGLIMPLYVPWFREVPVVSASQYGPVSISSKSINYLLCLQMALASKASMLSTVCGLISGMAVYCTPVKKFRLPGWVGTIFSKTIGQLVSTYPEDDPGLMGATLEIQRSQHTEALENQIMRARNRFQVPVNGGGRQLRIDEMWAGAGAGGGAFPGAGAGAFPGAGGGAFPGAGGNQDLPLVQGHVQTLVDMGFSRERAENALRQARNNIDEATNILLQDIM